MGMILNFEQEDLNITINVGDQTEIIHLRNSMRINDKNLPKEFSEQPSWFAWYAALLTDQEDKLSNTKKTQERYHSEISLKLRQGKLKVYDEAQKPLKLTEGGIKDYIENDQKYQVYKDKIQEFEVNCKKLKNLVNASIQRKDMLFNMGMLARQEIKNLGFSA